VLGGSSAIGRDRPATERPSAPGALPAWSAPALGAGGGFAFPEVRKQGTRLELTGPSAALVSTALRKTSSSNFSDLLLGRMNLEAHRLRRSNPERLTPAWALLEDSHMERLRTRHARRILTRAFDKTFDHQLEAIARATPGLRDAFAWVEGVERSSFTSLPLTPGERATSPATRSSPPRFKARLGFKLDAHPRLMLKTELFKIRGRIEIPLRNDPLRITFERRLGPHSGVKLTSGLSSGNDDWVRLSLRLGF
jgi:hypothetical protein